MGTTCSNGSCATSGTQARVWVDTFLVNTSNTAGQCNNWNAFRASLASSGYTSVTIKGSNDMTGVTCTGPNANTLCQALRTGGSASVVCNARTWTVGMCGGVEISASGACVCTTPAYTVRPCINNLNWGGINTTNCGAPSQAMSVICD
jgi:hypothetical protein